jgi:DNA-binding protein YbaB
VNKDDIEMLQDLLTAAFNEAARKVDDAVREKVGSLSGGLGGLRIPGLT